MSENNFLTNMGEIPVNKESYVLTDVVDSDEIYVGTSQRGYKPDVECWRIKKLWKEDTIWYMGFPDANQSFAFIWDERKQYNYS